MADFELPDSFDGAEGLVQNAGADSYSNDFFDNSPVAQQPVYVEPTGMAAFGALAEKDALVDFNKTWQASLDAKATEEVALAQTLKQTASEELKKWTDTRDMRLNKKKEINRTSEAVVKETLAAAATDKANWGRVLKLVNVADSAPAGQSDTERMQKLFIQLKNEPLAGR